MKSLKRYIIEMVQNCKWETVSDIKELTLERIQGCIGHSSFMDERSWGIIDNRTYEKIGINKWQNMSCHEHVICDVITDNKLHEIIQTAQKIKFKLLISE